MSDIQDGVTILVVGSSRLEDAKQVHIMLDAMRALITDSIDLQKIVSGTFSGVDAHVKSWCECNNIKFSEMAWAGESKMSRSHFRDRVLNQMAFAESPEFKSAAEALENQNVSLLVVIPGPEGELGAAAQNMCAIASQLGIDYVDGSKFVKELKSAIDIIRDEDTISSYRNKVGM